ncbi:MAG: DUF1778 domain-containing protein [Candidatus Dormiibacterota bacterium]
MRQRESRIHLQATREQDALLREAAADQGESLTGFLLSAALERARQVVGEARMIRVSPEAFDRLSAQLAEPPRELSVLRRYMARTP